MNCTVVYGISRNIKRQVVMPVAEAFRKLKNHEFTGWLFVNVYYKDSLVYTTQSVAGYRFVCDDCPYYRKEKN